MALPFFIVHRQPKLNKMEVNLSYIIKWLKSIPYIPGEYKEQKITIPLPDNRNNEVR
jgi:hypothetical protein